MKKTLMFIMNIPEGWAIRSEDAVSKAHGDLGYEIDYSLCFSEKADFAIEVPEKIKKTAKAGYVFLNKLTGHLLQKGIDGLWRVISKEGLNPSPMKKAQILKQKMNPQPQEENPTQEEEEEDNSPTQEEEEEEGDNNPPKEENPVPEQKQESNDLVSQIRSNKSLKQSIDAILKSRAEGLQWIENKLRDEDSEKTRKITEEFDKTSRINFESAIEEVSKRTGLNRDALLEYMNSEARVFIPKRGIQNNAKYLIREITNYKVNQYDEDAPKDDEVLYEDTVDYYKDIIERHIRKLCKVTGKDPEKEIERVFKKIDDRAEDRANREIRKLENIKSFKGNFIADAEKRGFDVEAPEGNNQSQDYALIKNINGNRLEFTVDSASSSPSISFTVNDSYDKPANLDEKTRRALAVATAKAFTLLLKNYKDSEQVFKVAPYDGDDNGDYRAKAYKDMGFGEIDEHGYMRGQIINGKMVPIQPGEGPVMEDYEDEDDEEEFAEKNKNMVDAIYKILFLEDMK